ncbi:hypothetical protein C5167_050958, partial [Papaver somniferum]
AFLSKSFSDLRAGWLKVDAAIIRIMNTRKVLSHASENLLVFDTEIEATRLHGHRGCLDPEVFQTSGVGRECQPLSNKDLIKILSEKAEGIMWHFCLLLLKWTWVAGDLPEQAMGVKNVVFRASTPARLSLNHKIYTRPKSKRDTGIYAGLSSIMDARNVYMMLPFAESVLQGAATNAEWVYDTPFLSDVEAKPRQLLIKLGYEDPPVQPDSLFPVFWVTKGITTGLVHPLIDSGKLKLEEIVAIIWPVFGANVKDNIKAHHVLNHTSGLHNALANIMSEIPPLLCERDGCFYPLMWLCGGFIEHASCIKLHDVLEEKLIHPLNIEGVESRLATLTHDMEDLKCLSNIGNRPDLSSSFEPENPSQLVTVLPTRVLAPYSATLAGGIH